MSSVRRKRIFRSVPILSRLLLRRVCELRQNNADVSILLKSLVMQRAYYTRARMLSHKVEKSTAMKSK